MCANTTTSVHLLRSDRAESLELDGIVKSNEVNPFMIEALPSGSTRTLAKTFQVELGVIGGHVVFSGHVEDLLLFQIFQVLVEHVKFESFGKMSQVLRCEESCPADAEVG